MILSASAGILTLRYGDFKSIPVFSEAGFDAVDYYFSQFVPDNRWGEADQEDYMKKLLDVASENGIFYNINF